MSYNITILERMVLETLNTSEKNINTIQERTSINKMFLNKIMTSLIAKNLITIKEDLCVLNRAISPAVTQELNEPHSLMSEVNEIITSCLRDKITMKNQQSFKLKKVNMTEREEKIFRGLIYNIESFINSLTCNDNIKDQKIIFWGEGRYADIKDSILNY